MTLKEINIIFIFSIKGSIMDNLINISTWRKRNKSCSIQIQNLLKSLLNQKLLKLINYCYAIVLRNFLPRPSEWVFIWSHLFVFTSLVDFILKWFIKNMNFYKIVNECPLWIKSNVNYALATNQINRYWRFTFKKFEVFMIPVAIENLLFLTPYQASSNFLNPLRP